MKLVFDTNIFISTLVFPKSTAAKALTRIIEGHDRLIISKPIIDELLGVLARKFSRDREALAQVAVMITEIGDIVKPRGKIKLLKDEPDNRILECAVAGKVDAIVTGDHAFLAINEYKGIKIISLKDYLESDSKL